MNSMMKINEPHSGYIKITHPLTNLPITGLIQGDFDIQVLSNNFISSDTVIIVETNSVTVPGEYYWTHTATELGSRRIEMKHEVNINGSPFILKWRFSFGVVEQDLQDVYDKVDSLTIGEGSELVTIYAKETGTELPIPEADYEIWDEGNLIRLHSGNDSDNDGNQEFNLNPGDYKVKLRKSFWNFPVVVDLIVPPGGTYLIIHGERLLPSSPSVPGLCVVFGYTYGVNGRKLPGAIISAKLTDPSAFADSLKIAKMTSETVSNSEGYFELELIPNDDYKPTDTKYIFTVTKTEKGKDDFRWEQRGVVPDQPSADFKNIVDC